MLSAGWALVLAALVVGGAQAGNPRQGDPAAMPAGAALFRERCADCHGDDAKGGRGPDLTRVWTTEGADARVFQTIRSGVPGSIMPPTSAPDQELRAIVAYLRNISTAKLESASGNVVNGEQLFTASCLSCHRVNGRGGRLGPDLSRIAASQSNQVLTRAIREASASFASGYEPVTLVGRDGQKIRGTRKGEDAFSIQIMDTTERLRGFVKANLREVVRDRNSLMPDFGPDRVSDQDVADLVAFLATFRASAPPARPGDRPVNDR